VLVGAPLIIYALIAVTSPLTGLVFVFENNSFYRGPLYLLQVVLCCLGVLVSSARVYLSSFNQKTIFRQREYRITASLVIVPLIGGTIQISFPGNPGLAMGLTVGMLITYLRLQTAKRIETKYEETTIIEENNNAKTKFLARMSHEVRIPITSIMGLNEAILRNSSEEETLAAARDIRSSTMILMELINEILDINKLENGSAGLVEMEYDTKSFFNDLVTEVKSRLWESNLYYNVSIDEKIPRTLKGDAVKLRQIFMNLLSNAVKFSKIGGVTLQVDADIQGEECILDVKVSDTGNGMNEEQLQEIFRVFERFDDKKRTHIEGPSRGLAIANSFLNMMNSQMVIDSVCGQGTSVSFSVRQEIVNPEPMGKLGEEENQKTYSYRAGFTAPDSSILVVDDSRINRKVIKSLLRDTQMKIDEVDCGEACLEMVAKKKYELIFLDHLMPGMDGVETYLKMKEMEENLCKDTPVIMLTANTTDSSEQEYMDMGFDGFLSKPIDTKKLEKVMKKILDSENCM